MKLLNTPINIIVIYDEIGNMKPYKFKYKGSLVVVQKIYRIYEGKQVGKRFINFVCIHDEIHIYELKYIIEDHKWYLYKK